MKVLVISDIHGLKTNLELIKEKFFELKCDELIVLGDLYYNYGRTNQKDFDPTYVRNFLDSFSDKLICIKGNCDEGIDIHNEPINIISGYFSMKINSTLVYLTHGHIYNKNNFPHENSILIFGHTHVAEITKIGTNIFINPGSISLPLGKKPASYMIIDNDEYTIVDINDCIIDQIKIPSSK